MNSLEFIYEFSRFHQNLVCEPQKRSFCGLINVKKWMLIYKGPKIHKCKSSLNRREAKVAQLRELIPPKTLDPQVKTIKNTSKRVRIPSENKAIFMEDHIP